MAYLKPPLFTRAVFNKLAMRTGMSGAESLVVAGRRTGTMQRIPVIPVELDGSRYLVSTRGESEWVRNLRAAGGRLELRGKGGTRTCTAVELPVEERAPVLDVYRAKLGKMVAGYFAQLPDPADHPVFRLG